MKVMKKFIRNITAGAALLLMVGSCTDKFEEYNTNQYQIHEADPATLMKSMIETIVNIQQNDSQMQDQMVGQYGGYFCVSNVWSGTNFGTYNQSDAWNASPWNTNFQKIYGNFFQVKEATNSSGHYYAFACMIRAINMLRIADTYGPMPYSQVKKGNFYVSYDTQEQVYKAILEDLANAAEVLYNYHVETNGNAPLGANDPVFAGNYASWAKLANSMRLRVAMRISSFLPDVAKEAAEAATSHKAGLIEANNDNAMMDCGTQTNPYQLAAVSWSDLRVNANIVDYMAAYKDPRAAKYFNASTIAGLNGQYAGMRMGDKDFAKADAGGYSTPNISGSDKLLVFCAAETAFLRAEGKLRGWNVGSKTAKEYYEEGITLSMSQYGVSAADYLTDETVPTVTHVSDNVQKAPATISNTVCVKWDDADNTLTGKNFQRIITQKWIANYPLGLEAWAEQRRTGYPEFYPCIDNLSDGVVSTSRGARRLAFPYTEKQNNKANCDQGALDLGGNDTPATDLKWAKKD